MARVSGWPTRPTALTKVPFNRTPVTGSQAYKPAYFSYPPIAGRAQRNLNGMQYTAEIASGARIQVSMYQTEIKIGDCVNVEQAGSGTANVRRVSSALCEAAASNTVDSDIRTGMTQSADRFLAAKDRLVDAATDGQIDAAVRRVKILCDD